MPFARPTLSELKAQVAADVQANLQGVSALLRYAVLRVITVVQAGLAFLHYGYIDWIAKQAVPWTSSDEYLVGWGALKNVFQKSATASSGTATFVGTPGRAILAGTTIVRGDQRTYIVETDAVVDGTNAVSVSVIDSETGAAGNCDIGTVLSLGTSIAGIQSTGSASSVFVGGADVETTEDFQGRVIAAYQASPQGGSQSDYVSWATQISGVTRAWSLPNGFGAGTVVLYFMMDEAEAPHAGFPQGTNGVASAETRTATKATGDQLIVADAIYSLQPVTALVYACAPVPNAVPFTISGVAPSLQSAVNAAIDDVFLRKGAPGGVVDINDINSGISAVSGTAGFVVTSPVGNITSDAGFLPTRGTVTYI